MSRDEMPNEKIDSGYGGRKMIEHLRRATMDQLAAYEQQLGMSPTTSEKLYWLRIKGPADNVLLRQVRHGKRCEQDRIRSRLNQEG